MEDGLDDAIHILRSHADPATGIGDVSGMMPSSVPTHLHSNGWIGGAGVGGCSVPIPQTSASHSHSAADSTSMVC